MKLLFIYPNPSGYSRIPIGLAMLCTCAKKSGHKVKVFDTTFFKLREKSDDQIREKLGQVRKTDLSPYGVTFKEKNIEEVKKDLLKVIEEFKPDICCFTVNESMVAFGFELAQEIKKYYNLLILFGGVAVTMSPDEIISKDCVDVICIGEGEKALVDLLDALEKKRDISRISNLWVKKDGQIIKNKIGNLVDINKLPFLDFDEFSDKHFYRPFGGKVYRMATFEKKRGCPFRCSFCENAAMQDIYRGRGKYLRKKSTERAIKELKFLKDRYKIEFFFFVDSDFCLESDEELSGFLKKYKEEINLPFFIEARVDSVNERKLSDLKKAGCETIAMSIESGNPYIRQEILNKKVTNKQIIQAFNLARKIGLKANSQNIIGNPEEKRKEIFDTIEVNRAAKPYSISANFLIPYKGTEIRRLCVERGYIEKSFTANEGIREKPVLKLPQISQEELIGLQKTFSLYVKLPKFVYPAIKICERENSFSSLLYPLLIKWMWLVK